MCMWMETYYSDPLSREDFMPSCGKCSRQTAPSASSLKISLSWGERLLPRSDPSQGSSHPEAEQGTCVNVRPFCAKMGNPTTSPFLSHLAPKFHLKVCFWKVTTCDKDRNSIYENELFSMLLQINEYTFSNCKPTRSFLISQTHAIFYVISVNILYFESFSEQNC